MTASGRNLPRPITPFVSIAQVSDLVEYRNDYVRTGALYETGRNAGILD